MKNRMSVSGGKNKIFFPLAVLALLASAALMVQIVQAKTIKKMVVKSIDHDEKTLEAVKEGDTYTVNATSAKIRKGSTSTKSLNFSTVREGDVVTIEGTFDDTNVTATKVRDLSYYDKHTVTFYGEVESINTDTNTFKIDTLDRDDQTVSITSSTKFRDEDDDKIEFANLKEDDIVLITGKWNRKKDTITRTTSVYVQDEDDYEDLDD